MARFKYNGRLYAGILRSLLRGTTTLRDQRKELIRAGAMSKELSRQFANLGHDGIYFGKSEQKTERAEIIKPVPDFKHQAFPKERLTMEFTNEFKLLILSLFPEKNVHSDFGYILLAASEWIDVVDQLKKTNVPVLELKTQTLSEEELQLQQLVMSMESNEL